MKRLFSTSLAAAAMALASASSFAGSTINPSTPAQNAALNSAPIRANFQSAYNDINNLLSMYYGPSAPQSPSNLQSWANSSGYPIIVLSYYNSATATWIPYARVNVSSNTYQSLVGTGVAATPPIAVTYPSGIATFALNYGADFTLSGNSLVLATENASPGTFGDATHVAQVSVDAKGRTTAAVDVVITHAANDLVAANNLDDLANVGAARTNLGLGAIAVTNPGIGLAIDGSGNLDLQPGTASSIGGVSAGTAIAISPTGAANLQPAQAATIGGVESDTSTAHQWIAYIDSSGVPHQSQPQLSDIGGLTNGISNANLAQANAATFKGNPTAALANDQDFTVQGLTNDASPDMVNDVLPIFNHLTGTLQNVSASQLFGSVGNVTSVKNTDGSLNISPTVGNVVASLSAARQTLPTVSTVTATSHTGGFSANGSGLYSTPANVLWLEVRFPGAGGGGAGGNNSSSATAGGVTCLNSSGTTCASGTSLYMANGGLPGVSNSGGAGGTVTGTQTCNIVSQVGGTGSNGVFSGAPAGSPGFVGGGVGGNNAGFVGGGPAVIGNGGNGVANSGGGGAGGGINNVASENSGGGGGAGGFCDTIINSPAASYGYNLGIGGVGAAAGSGGFAGGSGASGAMTIVEHYGSWLMQRDLTPANDNHSPAFIALAA